MQSGLEEAAVLANYGWVRWKFLVGTSKNRRRRVYSADFPLKCCPSIQTREIAPLAEHAICLEQVDMSSSYHMIHCCC